MATKRGAKKIVPKSGTRVPAPTVPRKGAKASSFAPLYARNGKRNAKELYIHTRTGQVISKRAYYTLKRGGVSNEKLSASRRERGIPNKLSKNNALVSDYQKSLSLYGVERSRGDIRKSEGYKKMLRYLESGDRAPGGKMDIALQALGRRPPDATYAVGDTPRIARRRWR